MDDLTTWLREQIDVDEKKANAAHAGPWQLETGSVSGWSWVGASERSVLGDFEVTRHPDGGQPDGTVSAEDGEHIVNFDPNRARREVQTKRKIISWLESKYGTPQEPGIGGALAATMADAEITKAFKVLAVPYSDRPGYRDQWRP